MAHPGLIIDIPDVNAEGMLFAGTKLYEEGRRNEALWEYIRRNSRAARQLQDDLDAQIASARLGMRRFNELLERYGIDTVLTATHQLMDYTERVLRQRIDDAFREYTLYAAEVSLSAAQPQSAACA